MSWNVEAIGKAPAVAAEIEKQFARSVCCEPEETVRQSARATIAVALAAQEPKAAVLVKAFGNQSLQFGPDGKTPISRNWLHIAIEPQSGFVE